MSSASHIRVKRAKQTIFLYVEPTDTILVVKAKVAKIDSDLPADKTKILYKGAECDPKATLQSLHITDSDGTAVHLITTKDDGTWETLADLEAEPMQS
mmetsp:Transcript_1949/g.2160  ORF Transcript_1949/g.2160 Transcript_1949/m.2160 type:complete len:98 (+) Transcript_1949:273-566(+)